MSRPSSPAAAASRAAALQAWARVTILLDLAQVEQATLAARQASDLTHWHRLFGGYQKINVARVYDGPVLPVGWMWMEPQNRRVLLSRDTVARFGLSIVMFEFAEVVTRIDEPGFRFYDRDNWLLLDNANRVDNGLQPHD